MILFASVLTDQPSGYCMLCINSYFAVYLHTLTAFTGDFNILFSDSFVYNRSEIKTTSQLQYRHSYFYVAFFDTRALHLKQF